MSGAGFVNAHTHVYSGLASLGMPPPRHEPSNFLEILEAVWWRLDRAIDERSLRAAARLYVAEALRHGTTVLVDHHESPSFIEGSLDVIADSGCARGIGAALARSKRAAAAWNRARRPGSTVIAIAARRRVADDSLRLTT